MGPTTAGGQVEVRGARLAYETRGSGPPLIWGHGLSMNRVSDARLGQIDWTRVPATVVRYDARGHGDSDSTPDLDAYSWEELGRDQLALADSLGFPEYVAGGASMGCGTALHAAVLAPGRVRRLVLVIPPTGWETRAAQAGQWETFAALVEREGIEALIEARGALPPPDPFVGDEDRQARQVAATRMWEPGRLALVLRGATRANLPDREAVAGIRAPALILAWTGDPVHPESTARELAGLLRHSELHVASTAAEVAAWTGLVADFVSES